MPGWWQEYITDNPFILALRRRWGRGLRIPLTLAACSGLPALLLLLLLAARSENPGRATFSSAPVEHWGLGMLVLAHWAARFWGHRLDRRIDAASGYRLPAIREPDPLGDVMASGAFPHLRLVPRSGWELMRLLGVAAGARRLFPVLPAAPVYLAALACGLAPAAELAALAVLHALAFFDPPSAGKVAAAVSAEEYAARGGLGPRTTLGATPVISCSLAGCLGIAAFTLLAWKLLPLAFGWIQPLFARLLPGADGVRPLAYPLLAVPTLLAFLAAPRPFFTVQVAPLWLVAAWWLLGVRARLAAGARAWDVPDGAPAAHPARRREQSAAAALRWLRATALLGLAWQPLLLSGALGQWIDTQTPGGSLGALLSAAGVVLLLRAAPGFGAALAGAEPIPALRRASGRLLRSAGVLLAAVLGLCAAGQISPWPEPALSAGRLGLAALGCLGGAAAGAVALRRSGASSGAAVLLAVLLPAAAVTFAPRDPAWHLPAAFSPLYPLLFLLPGLWSPPLPPLLSLLPLAALLPAALPQAPVRKPAAEAAGRGEAAPDPLLDRLEALAAAWDNPFLVLAVRRRRRAPGTLTGSVCSAPMTLLLASGALAGVLPAALPAAVTRASFPGLFWLLGAALLLVLLGMYAGDTARLSLELGSPAGDVPLLMSPLADRGVVAGLLGSLVPVLLPSAAGALLVSFLWCLAGVAAGAPPWVVACWALAAGALLLGATFSALRAFFEWAPTPSGWRGSGWLIPAPHRLGLALLWMAGGAIAYRFGRHPAAWALLAPGLVLGTLALLLPAAYRNALECVAQYRSELEE